MTRKDYIVIAEIIAELNWDEDHSLETVLEVARIFAVKLKRDNRKFNEDIFLDYIKERM